jgi:hypothetical protein
MTLVADPLVGIDSVPWSRIVHFYGRATEVPGNIRDLATDNCAEAQNNLLGCLEHQDGVAQATPFAVWFIIKMLNAGAVRDPEGVRRLLAVIHAAARSQLECNTKLPGTMDWNALLAEEHLWPGFKSERDDEIHWEEWEPLPEESNSWVALTDKIISEGLGISAK